MTFTEQRAKELLDEIVDAVCDGQIPTRQALKGAIGRVVAAALAACALDEAKWWARYHGKDYNGEGTARLAALERTAGEKV